MNKIFNYTKIMLSLFFMAGCINSSYAHENNIYITKFGQQKNNINYNNDETSIDELGILLDKIAHEQSTNQPLQKNQIFNNKTILVPVPQPKSYIVYDYQTKKILDYKNPNIILPIASVTKLMTAYTFLSLNKNPNCTNQITDEDTDTLKGFLIMTQKAQKFITGQYLEIGVEKTVKNILNDWAKIHNKSNVSRF